MAETFQEIVEDIRDVLAVSSDSDATILRAVKQGARMLLRDYNFPKSVVPATYTLGNPTSSVVLDIDTGKIKAVRLHTNENDTDLYKLLRRRTVDALPSDGGPNFYSMVGEELWFDKPLEETGYNLQVWYQSTDPDANEGWFCQEFDGILFALGAFNACPRVSKPELQQTFVPAVQVERASLAVFLNELEWNDHDMRMGADRGAILEERYGSGYSS